MGSSAASSTTLFSVALIAVLVAAVEDPSNFCAEVVSRRANGKHIAIEVCGKANHAAPPMSLSIFFTMEEMSLV